MKFATFDRIISPEVGARIAGYGIDQFSVCKADDLHAVGLLADDGTRRILIVCDAVSNIGEMRDCRVAFYSILVRFGDILSY